MYSRKEMTGLLYALVRTEVPHFAWQPISLNGFLCLLKSKEKVPAPLLEWYPTWEPRVQCVRFAYDLPYARMADSDENRMADSDENRMADSDEDRMADSDGIECWTFLPARHR